MDPVDPQVAALAARGHALIQVRRYAEAVQWLRRAAAADPENALVHALLAVCLSETARPRDALIEANRAVELAPEEEFGHRVRSAVLLQRGKKRQAVRAAYEAIRLAAAEPLTHIQLCWALVARGKALAARRAAEEAIRLDPSMADAYKALGAAAMAGRENSAAEGAFRKALQLDPNDPEALNNLAVIVRLRGRMSQARELFTDAARSDPRASAPAQNLTAMSNTFLRMTYMGTLTLTITMGAWIVAETETPWPQWAFLSMIAIIYAARRTWRTHRNHYHPRLMALSMGLRGLLVATTIWAGFISVAVVCVGLIGGSDGAIVAAFFMASLVGLSYLLTLGPEARLFGAKQPKPVPPGAYRERRSLSKGFGLFLLCFSVGGFTAIGLFAGVIPELLNTTANARALRGENITAALTMSLILGLCVLGCWRAARRMRQPHSYLTPISVHHPEADRDQ